MVIWLLTTTAHTRLRNWLVHLLYPMSVPRNRVFTSRYEPLSVKSGFSLSKTHACTLKWHKQTKQKNLIISKCSKVYAVTKQKSRHGLLSFLKHPFIRNMRGNGSF